MPPKSPRALKTPSKLHEILHQAIASAEGDSSFTLIGDDRDLAEKSKRLTNASKKDSKAVCQQVVEQEKMVKLVLVKREAMKLPKAKEIMLEAAAALKACKDEAKELRALANKAGSKASKK